MWVLLWCPQHWPLLNDEACKFKQWLPETACLDINSNYPLEPDEETVDKNDYEIANDANYCSTQLLKLKWVIEYYNPWFNKIIQQSEF